MTPDERAVLKGVSSLWWIWLVMGVAWSIVGLVILQFDEASITTVGLIIGFMFIGSGLQQLTLSSFADELRWLYVLFGLLFLICGFVALFNPEDTFAAVADVLGFLFLVVGVFWIIGAFATRSTNELWWVGLVAGILMVALAFWTSGQFFIEKQYVLLVFAGIWALLHGVTDLVKAFQVRRLGRFV
jgi:uncharacterized membrane protein HdeD (DUF308 family)